MELEGISTSSSERLLLRERGRHSPHIWRQNGTACGLEHTEGTHSELSGVSQNGRGVVVGWAVVVDAAVVGVVSSMLPSGWHRPHLAGQFCRPMSVKQSLMSQRMSSAL